MITRKECTRHHMSSLVFFCFATSISSTIVSNLFPADLIRSKLEETMENEHSKDQPFFCDIFETATSPAKEWALVVDVTKRDELIKLRRSLLKCLDDYIKIGKGYQLEREEVISLVLATGPMVLACIVYMHFKVLSVDLFLFFR